MGYACSVQGVPTDKTQYTCDIVRRCEEFVPSGYNIDIVVLL